MWFEWRSIGCRDAWCTGNSRLAKETKVDQNCGIKTWSKPISLWCHINPREPEGYPMDRPKCRGSVHRAAANFEEAWCQKLTAARERHRRAALAVITTTDFQCPHCSRLGTSRLGLRSYLRVHRWVVECKRHHRIRWTTTSYPILPPWQDLTQGQLFSEVLLVWIQSFPYPRIVVLPRLKSLVYSTYSLRGGEIDSCPFQKQ